jgi:hypothetical protein
MYSKVLTKVRAAAVAITLVALPLAPASAHGGGLDGQGGHNCNVGACAGTYHCHQPRGPVCAAALKAPTFTDKKLSSKKSGKSR